MSNEIIKIINDLCDKFGIAIDWTEKNVMPQLLDLFGRLQYYKIMSCIVAIGTSLVLGIFCALLIKKVIKSYSKSIDKQNIFWTDNHGTKTISSTGEVCLILPVLALLIIVPIFIANIMALLKWIYIPEMQTYQYIQYLIN